MYFLYTQHKDGFFYLSIWDVTTIAIYYAKTSKWLHLEPYLIKIDLLFHLIMGNKSTKSSLRNAIVLLNISAESISLNNDKFWNQIWQEDNQVATEVIKSISLQEIRMLRDGSPQNFATLIYKMVDRLQYTTNQTLCNTQAQQTAVLNSTKILTRLIPCVFEDKNWRDFFLNNHIGIKNPKELSFPKGIDKNYLSYLPDGTRIEKSNDDDMGEVSQVIEQVSEINLLSLDGVASDTNNNDIAKESSKKSQPIAEDCNYNNTLMKCLILSVCDLLFCPEFTVVPHNDKYLSSSIDAPPEELKSLPTCEYVWEPGVGFDLGCNSTKYYDKSRSELMRLLLTTLSVTLYYSPQESIIKRNIWLEIFVSEENRHVLPLFTSILNTIFIYKPAMVLSPFNYILSEDNREELVDLCIQVLIATLDYHEDESSRKTNLFIEYISRIHRNEDLIFLIKGFSRLLNNSLEQNYMLHSSKSINFNQELLILFWRISNLNSRFVTYLLKSSDILDITVPILHHLNENFQDESKQAIIHIGVFNLLILSGERNFGVRLNKPYVANVLLNLPTFTGSHADLLIIVFHKLILYGHNLNQLFDYLLTILVNISPYLKALSILASKCLIQLFEIFSSAFIILTEPCYHKIVVFLLEIFNNIIQYQFDGNANLVYVVLSKREAFLNLANLPTTASGIDKVLSKLVKKKQRQMMIDSFSIGNGNSNDAQEEKSQSLAREVSLIATPDIAQVTKPVFPFENKEHELTEIESNKLKERHPSITFDDILNEDVLDLNQATKSTSEVETINQEPNDLSPIAKESRWKPSSEWVKDWKQKLPLHTTLRMIEVLTPQLERIKQVGSNSITQHDELETIKFLQNGTLVGLLPVPHPIMIRKYRTNKETTLWFRTCTWGIIHHRNTIWASSAMKLVDITN